MFDDTQQFSFRRNVTAASLVFVCTLLSGGFGVAIGIVMAHVAPANKFSWAGLAVAPLWLVLEVVFEAVIAIFGVYSKTARVLVTVALVLGFYGAWFSIRP